MHFDWCCDDWDEVVLQYCPQTTISTPTTRTTTTAIPTTTAITTTTTTSGGSCKVRQEWIEANPDVPMVSSCPEGEGVFLNKLADGTWKMDDDLWDDFPRKWHTVNPDLSHNIACKFNKI